MKNYKQYILLTKNTQDENILKIVDIFKKKHQLVVLPQEYIDIKETLDKESFYILYLDDNSIKELFKTNMQIEANISILPNELCPDAVLKYGLSNDFKSAIVEALDEKLRLNEELLVCNGEIAFKKISIGNVQNLNKHIFDTSLYQNFKDFFYNLKNLKYQAMSFVTAQGEEVKTVSSGVLILEDFTLFSTLKSLGSSSFHDERLNAFIIAPYSIASYLYHLFIIFLYHKFSIGALPKNISFISSKSLQIKSKEILDFSIDDTPMSTKEIEVEVVKSSLKIIYGKNFAKAIEEKNESDKEEKINIKSLPTGEMKEFLIAGNVPLIKKASDDDIKDMLILIRDNSKVTSIFLTLMVLSTLLATVGIFQDSIPSVVGAMILAPLMAPVISLSMGAARSDRNIIKSSMITLAIGIASTLMFSSLLTLIIPLDMMTVQMSSRINPNILDLVIAVFSGIAGAYASAKEEVAKSLAGVAIAVALVPPLCVSGIGLGWGNFEIIYGSFLLFMTNLFGMVAAASLTFIILGFAPIQRATKSLLYSFLMLSIICIPLIFSFHSLILQSNDYSKLKKLDTFVFDTNKVTLHVLNIKSSTSEKVTIEAEIISKKLLKDKEYMHIKRKLEERMAKKVVLHVIPKIVIE